MILRNKCLKRLDSSLPAAKRSITLEISMQHSNSRKYSVQHVQVDASKECETHVYQVDTRQSTTQYLRMMQHSAFMKRKKIHVKKKRSLQRRINGKNPDGLISLMDAILSL